MNIGNNIYLCTDPYVDPSSIWGYTGRIYALSLWNVSFTAQNVADFYLQVREGYDIQYIFKWEIKCFLPFHILGLFK